MLVDVLGDASASIAPSGREGVGRADNLLVEEPGDPDLARNKGSTQDPDEETERHESVGVGDQSGQGRWNRASKQQSDKDQARTEAIAERAGDEADEESALSQNVPFEFEPGRRPVPYVASNATMFEFAISTSDMCMSWAMVTASYPPVSVSV